MDYKHKTLFLDIETSGLPVKMVPGKKKGTIKKQQLDYETEYMDFPFIVSIAWAINDEDPTYHIINPEGKEIPKEATDIHGITTEEANKSEITINQAIDWLVNDAKDTEIVVGHGLYFDTSIIKANCLRIDKSPKEEEDKKCCSLFSLITGILHKHKRIDTMRSSAKMCRKWPKLEELYTKIFRKGFNAHSSKDDLIATRKCYEWLLKKDIVPSWEKLQEKKLEKENHVE